MAELLNQKFKKVRFSDFRPPEHPHAHDLERNGTHLQAQFFTGYNVVGSRLWRFAGEGKEV